MSPSPPRSPIHWLIRFVTRYAEVPEGELRLELRQAQPSYSDEYRHHFSCPVVFSARHDALVFSVDWLAVPLVPQSNTMTRAFEMRCQQLLQTLGIGQERLAPSVRALVSAHLEEGIVSMSWAADCLRVSVPTLRRRLHEESTTFSSLLDEVRVGLAERRLKNPAVSLMDVAVSLGFSNVSAFDRAFRRWRDQTPSQYRAERGPGAPHDP